MVYFYPMLTKSDRTKMFIIEKSAPIFNTKGYAATSMQDILQATGLAKGGIYGNFASKDEIAVEAFDFAMNVQMDAIAFKIKQEKTSAGKLIAVLQFYKNFTVAPLIEGGCPLMNTAVDADDNIPFLKERAMKALKKMLSSLEYIIQRGIDNGEFSPTLNVQTEAAMIFATIEGGVMMSKLSNDPKILNNLLLFLQQQIETRFKA